MIFDQTRRTSNDKIAAVLRLLLGFVFSMAGILKVAVPFLGEAFAGQLNAANIPFQDLNLFVVPIVEMLLGITLLVGIYVRLSAVIAAVIMVVATYVHVVADDPSLFPLQPVEPIGPLVLLIGLAYLLWRGGGAWSIDLREVH